MPVLRPLTINLRVGVFEIVVVDDASTDDTCEVARGLDARVSNGENRGSYAARNLGIEAARASVLAFTDADCQPSPNWLATGLEAIESGLPIVAGKIEVPLGPRPSTAALLDFALHFDQADLREERIRCDSQPDRSKGSVRSGRQVQSRPAFGRRRGVRATSRRTGLHARYVATAAVSHDPRAHAIDLIRKAFRIGRSRSDHRSLGIDSLISDPSWIRPAKWMPRRSLPGFQRLVDHNLAGGMCRRIRLHCLYYTSVQLPGMIGEMAADRAKPRRLRRGRSLPV